MSNAYANVCQVLEGKKFRSMAGVQAARYVDRPTSGRGANLTIEFHVLPRSALDAGSAATVLNSVTRAEHGFSRIDSRFREHLDDHSNPVFQAVVWMLGYRLVTASDQSARARYGDAAGRGSEFDDLRATTEQRGLAGKADLRVVATLAPLLDERLDGLSIGGADGCAEGRGGTTPAGMPAMMPRL